MQEIKVNNCDELVSKIKELIAADKELKLSSWYGKSKTTTFEANKQVTTGKARLGAKIGRNWNEDYDVYIESEDDNNSQSFYETFQKTRNEIGSIFEPRSDSSTINPNYQPPQKPQEPAPYQGPQKPSSPNHYQPKPENKQPSQNNNDNENTLDAINNYFQENKVLSVELDKNGEHLIITRENGWIRCTPTTSPQMQKIKDYLEKNNKNSISKEELISLNKSKSTDDNPSVFYYLTWILGIFLIIVSGLAIRFWLLLRKRKIKKIH